MTIHAMSNGRSLEQGFNNKLKIPFLRHAKARRWWTYDSGTMVEPKRPLLAMRNSASESSIAGALSKNPNRTRIPSNLSR
jgi:hypothetical protein